MRYYLVAGEPSGDLYGAELMDAIAAVDTEASFRFWGGDRMRKRQDGLFHDLNESAYMGFKDVFLNLNKISKLFAATKKDIIKFKPDVIIYIDYPGFNLRLAKWAKQNGYRNVYFICPKIWAWKKNRYKTIKKNIDQLICVLPFEPDFLKPLGVESKYLGHPLNAILAPFKWDKRKLEEKSIGLLPGSRRSELKYVLPILNQLVLANPRKLFKLSVMDSLGISFYKKFIDLDLSNLELSKSSTSLLSNCSLAIVCSGTATLEAAIIGTPQIVVYKADSFSYHIAKLLVNLKYYSLPNLICDKEIVKELIQDDFTLGALQTQIDNLSSESTLNSIEKGYVELRTRLHSDNDSITLIAKEIIGELAN